MLDIMKRIDQGEYSITQDDFDAKTNQLTSCLFLIYAALTRRGILIIIFPTHYYHYEDNNNNSIVH